MLTPIEKLVADQFLLLFTYYDAIDTESGATLQRTNGRGKGGLPKYVLILPNEKPATDTDWAKYRHGSWEYSNRKFIRAWTFAEALEIANSRLAKMCKAR